MFDPALEALPIARPCWRCCWSAPGRIESGALDAGELVQVAYLFTLLAFPVRAIGWVLGELPRSVVGWDRVSRVLAATGGLPTAGGHRRRRRAGRARVRDVGFAYDDDGRCCTT